MNRKRLVVVLERKLFIYDLHTVKQLHCIPTAPNPKGVVSLSSSDENAFVAYPAGSATQSGEILVFDTVALQPVTVLRAHKSEPACLGFSPDGLLLATASEKGTLIRVFSVTDGQLIHQFRRGSLSSAIYSLSFNTASTLLCVSGDSDTIHVFRLEARSGKATGYLPEVLGNLFEERHFAFAKLPSSGLQNISTISRQGDFLACA